jgi:hypothetical protein
MPHSLRRLLLGTPLATSRLSHERIAEPVGLAVFAFIVSMLALIGVGLVRGLFFPAAAPAAHEALQVAEPLTIFLILRAFALRSRPNAVLITVRHALAEEPVAAPAPEPPLLAGPDGPQGETPAGTSP